MALITRLIGFSFTVAASCPLAAQSLDMGARGLALANAVVVASRFPFEPVNPASAMEIHSLAASFSFGQAHGLSELRHESAVVVYPFGETLTGATLQSFGFQTYRRLTAGLVLSTQIMEDIRLGIRTTYRRVAVAGYGSRAAVGVSAGWQAGVTEAIRAGGAWRYIGAPTGFRNRLLSQELSFGFDARASPNLRLLAAIAREVSSDADLRIGAEISLIDSVRLRLGTGTNPDRITFGLGLTMRTASIDAGVSVHRILGPSLCATVSLE